MSATEIADSLKRVFVFEKKPAAIAAYETVVIARGSFRARAFFRSYDRMNSIGLFNHWHQIGDAVTSGRDPFWKEIFFRRAFQNVIFSLRSGAYVACFAMYVFVFTQIDHVDLSGGLFWVILACAVAALLAGFPRETCQARVGACNTRV